MYNHIKPAIFKTNSNTTNPRCVYGHTWLSAQSIGLNLEGLPCDCGEVLFHIEKCLGCDNIIRKHIPNTK